MTNEKRTLAYWIRKKCVSGEYSEYECSICGVCFCDTGERCPNCNSVMERLVHDSRMPDQSNLQTGYM